MSYEFLMFIFGAVIVGAALLSLADKTCPHCRMRVKRGAVKCPHCQSDLSAIAQAKSTGPMITPPTEGAGTAHPEPRTKRTKP